MLMTFVDIDTYLLFQLIELFVHDFVEMFKVLRKFQGENVFVEGLGQGLFDGFVGGRGFELGQREMVGGS